MKRKKLTVAPMNAVNRNLGRCLGGCGGAALLGYRLCPECQEGANILNRNAHDRLKQEVEELRAALQGRTVSCVCGGEVERLRAALEPYANGGCCCNLCSAARAALAATKGGG
ncbi:MAG: hypothetical protein KJ648_07145 [Candidatus Omnitrophica bacterium]|nr:hypothetical protein [Candidatus Omnitrophota bacterium]